MHTGVRAVCIATAFTFTMPCFGDCAWSRIDHRWAYNASGPWAPRTYRALVETLAVADVGGALWEGADTRLGRTLWQGIDSTLIADLGAETGKHIFSRERPTEANDPCLWFKGGSHYSFPSGEAAVAAGLVTPYVLEYGRDNPAAFGLLLLPLYIGAARVKNQAHWQSDVIAGWTIGGLSGWYAHQRDTPLTVAVLPRGITIGWSKRFN